jgi:single-strand DNA-binding protein
MSEAIITLVGNVASEVRNISTDRGTAITSFRFAHTPRRIDRQTGRWGDGHTSFYSVTCWRSLAEHGKESLHKGDPVIVVGRLRIRDWKNDDGRTGRDAEIDAITVGHDLVRGKSTFMRATRERIDQADEADMAASLRMELLVAEQAQAAGEGSEADGGPDQAPGRNALAAVQDGSDQAA